MIQIQGIQYVPRLYLSSVYFIVPDRYQIPARFLEVAPKAELNTELGHQTGMSLGIMESFTIAEKKRKGKKSHAGKVGKEASLPRRQCWVPPCQPMALCSLLMAPRSMA